VSDSPSPPALVSPDAGAGVSSVVVWLALVPIAALGIAAALRRGKRRRRRAHAAAASHAAGPPPPMSAPRSEDAEGPSRTQHSPEPVIGYAPVAVGATPAERDRATSVIVAACKDGGRQLVEIVCDPVQGRPLERPGLMHALGRITDGHARGLVVSELQGISRSVAELATLIAWLRDAGATLLALDLELDTATPEGRRVATTLLRLASGEADDGRAEARTNGRPAVSDRPELRQRIASMRSAGMTLREIAEQLNAERVPTVRGGARWRPSSIQAALGYRRPGPRDRLPQLQSRG
jgi:DNA invertase Pin-like site-specific DNA recombinase